MSRYGRLSRTRVAAWALGLAALGPGPAVRAAELVIAATASPFSLPLYVAEKQGLYAAEGLAVRLEACNSGLACMQRLFEGRAHVITSSELPVMFNSFDRDDYAVLATAATSTSNIRIVGRRSAGISDAASLAGKRVGVLARSSLQYYLDVYLLYHGVEPSRVLSVSSSPALFGEALAARDIDAFVSFVHDIEPTLRQLGADGVLLDQPRLYTETSNLVSGRPMTIEREAEMVRLLRAVERAEAFIAAHPAEAGRILESQLKLEPGSATGIMSRFNYRLTLDSAFVGTLEREARWAQREGYVPAGRPPPPFLRYIAPGPLRSAVPAAAGG